MFLRPKTEAKDHSIAVGGDFVLKIGLEAAPATFRATIKGFIKAYLGSEDRPVPFGGRDAEIRELNEWLNDENAPRNLLIASPAGRGKTSLLVHWLTQVGEEWPVVFVPISLR